MLVPYRTTSRRPGTGRASGSSGFTLVELMIGLLCCSLVTLGAVTLTLTGLRVEAKAVDDAGRQQTARIVLTLLEDLASSGQVTTVRAEGGGWALLGGESGGDVLLRYRAGAGTIATGGGAALLDGLSDADIELNGSLLTLTVSTGKETWTTSAYCRMGMAETGADRDYAEEQIKELEESAAEKTDETKTYAARAAYLTLLCTQYGSTGTVLDTNGCPTGQTYSLWYCGGERYWDGWNEDTPWCACFLSWAAARMYEEQTESAAIFQTSPIRFAAVDVGVSLFKSDDNETTWRAGGETPLPGDYIFFDWEQDDDPDHVGAVLAVDEEKGLVYTIEGNSDGVVAIRSYALDDGCIFGYGVLDWAVSAGTGTADGNA